jgi:4-hydroxyphenylpyruvate dioxygenase
MPGMGDDAACLQYDTPLRFKGIDYVEFYVGNAYQAAHFYCATFGFTPIAYAGLETGLRDRVSFILKQQDIRFVLTSPLDPDGPIARHVHLHGDAIKDIAFGVEDAEQTFQEAVRRGAQCVSEPAQIDTDFGQMTKATIASCRDTVHSFIERSGYESTFLPGYQSINSSAPPFSTELVSVDHVAIGLEPGTLDLWTDFYEQVLGFSVSHQEDVLTEYSAMNSRVVQDQAGRIKFPMMEPAIGRRKSQIEEYLTFHRGAGVQHVALLSANIISSIATLKANRIDFLQTPQTYYDSLTERIGAIDEDIGSLRDLGILADRDESGYLMQTFTKPLQSRPTVFLEVIERKGAVGFGSGNIKALFEAVERQQEVRGNL